MCVCAFSSSKACIFLKLNYETLSFFFSFSKLIRSVFLAQKYDKASSYLRFSHTQRERHMTTKSCAFNCKFFFYRQQVMDFSCVINYSSCPLLVWTLCSVSFASVFFLFSLYFEAIILICYNLNIRSCKKRWTLWKPQTLRFCLHIHQCFLIVKQHILLSHYELFLVDLFTLGNVSFLLIFCSHILKQFFSFDQRVLIIFQIFWFFFFIYIWQLSWFYTFSHNLIKPSSHYEVFLFQG